jgi:UDP-glucose 4-epimerase
MDCLANRGHQPIGLDVAPRRSTDVVASILDRDALSSVLKDGHFDAVVHCAALHRPQLAERAAEFPSVNVVGTRNLLELAGAAGVSRFIYTSTTAVMTDRALAEGAINRARWLTEESPIAEPQDMYAATKIAAEDLCRAWHATTEMRMIILRPSRFFHRDLLEHSTEFTQANHRANEFLYRRAAVDDVAMAHALAVEAADRLVSDLFIVSAPTAFAEDDCRDLLHDAPTVVARHFPDFRPVYAERGWKMYRSIDRVYVARRAQDVLGLKCNQTFATQLD